ncbi:beta strand repeat-containing protein [Agromyces sp. Marseille-Q5079]|uniref:beta strand repeat-containing protein n=1 Tax=Agromyces sp. Marseille-Q5079 TaxID=3439059 RepID=UPI003D9C9427
MIDVLARSERRRRAVALGAALCLAALVGVLGTAAMPVAPASAIGQVPALADPDDPDTGDPLPPDDAPVPEGLDEPAPVPDDSVVEFPPPPRPGLVPNANSLPIAWVGTPDLRPGGGPVLTLQAALNAAPDGGTVSFDANDYAFTGSLAVTRSVTLDSASSSVLFTRLTVSAGGLALAPDVSLGVASTGATVSVTGSGVTLDGVTVRNPSAVARPTGVQLGAGLTGVVIDGYTMDGGGELSSYGVNLTTASATITDAAITGVATGILATAASTASGIAVSGGTVTASTSGISLGATSEPHVTDVEVTGPDATGTGIDLANSSGAVVDGVSVHGFARGIGTSTTNAADGPTITEPTIDGASREGIALGATIAPRVVGADITGADANQSTGILVFKATAAVIETPTVTGMMYGITTHLLNTGTGPVITAPRVTAFGAITLGSTQGASVSDAVLDAGDWGENGTGINLVNAGRATITNETATGFLYAVGAQSSMDPESDRVDISISDLSVVGAPNASSGVYLLGAENATITGIDAELTGAALVIHQSVGVNASDIVVDGREGPTPVTGAAILRAYGSQDVNVDDASIDGGSYGFFYSAADGATVTNATVANVVERAVYGRSVANLDVSASSFTGNAAVGVLVVTTPENGISHDISIHDNVMTGNGGGVHVLQGTTGVEILRNTVSGQPEFVTAGGAHSLLVSDNVVEQGPDAVAISVAPLWEDGAEPGSYSSSGIEVLGNAFSGGGTWISVGSSDPAAPDAARRTLRDPVLATGNVFPAASTAVQTYANAVLGEDAAATPVARALPVDGPVAVDARDHDDPNDWGSECRATGFLDGASYYEGGGAAVSELTEAPVLYPMNCIDLSLEQALDVADDEVLGVGELVTWTLTPHNEGPRAAPAGWTITQLLPDTVELVSLTGDGYSVADVIATSGESIPAGDDGPVLTVVVRILSVPSDTTTMRNVAYVAPAEPVDLDADGFVDEVFERLNPLVVPTLDTDTEASETDNDAQGVWSVAGSVTPEPPEPPDDGGETPGGGGETPGGGTPGGASGDGSSSADLARTGTDLTRMLALAALLLCGGVVLAARSRRTARVARTARQD